MRICENQNCNLKHYGKGMCEKHYKQSYLSNYRKLNKEKAKIQQAEWRKNNPESTEEARIRHQKYKQKNLEKARELNLKRVSKYSKTENGRKKIKEYREINYECLKIWTRNWAKETRYGVIYANKRRIQELNASLNCIGEEEMKNIYKNCPKGMVVDHIIPLINEKICGLNVPWNLQYLTVSENCHKHNKFDGTKENKSWLETFKVFKKEEYKNG